MKPVIDLSALPPPPILADLDVEAAFAEMQADFLTHMAEEGVDMSQSLRDSDPVSKVFQVQAGRETMVISLINNSNLANRIAFAEDGDLDGLLAFADMERQVIDPGDPNASPPVPPTYESNERARRRYVLHWNTLSNGAPEGFYESLILDSVSDAFDVYSVSPEPCLIDLYVLPRPGADPAQVLAAAQAVFMDTTKPPQGDRVSVHLATVKPYAIRVDLNVPTGGPDTQVVGAACLAKISGYVEWSETLGATPLGKSIEIPLLHGNLLVAGITGLTLSEPPAPIACGPSEAARCDSIEISINGVPYVG